VRRGRSCEGRDGTIQGLFLESFLVCTSPEIKIQIMEKLNLTDNFLIAMPTLEDPYFANTLVYICEHNDNGALGIIVNRPIDMDLAGLFEKIDIKLDAENLAKLPIYFGGPVQLDRGFVLHRPVGQWQSTLAVNADVGLTSSRDVLAAVGSAGLPDEIIVTLGYAGWDAGQLEDELAQNSWLTVPAKNSILFDLPPEDRLPAAMQKLGISFAQLSDVAGHA
jgi:putative transcriptional regulator